MFKNPFSFDGRIRRLEYGVTMIIYIAVYLGLMGITAMYPDAFFVLFLLLPVLWFVLAQGAKRCHDRGNSGWYQLIPFYNLILIFGDGEEGSNQYGLNPKGIGNDDELQDIGKVVE